MIQRIESPGAWYGENLPNGRYIVSYPSGLMETSEGPVTSPVQLIYPRINPTILKCFVGVGNPGDKALLFADGFRDGGPACGNSPVAFWPTGQLEIALCMPPYGSQGIRWIDTRIHPGDETIANPSIGMWQYTEIAGIQVGQGGSGVDGGDPLMIRYLGVRHLLESGTCRVIRFNLANNILAISCWKMDANSNVRFLLNVSDISSLPIRPLDLEKPMIAPVVSVNKWTLNELIDGREFTVTDTNNPIEGYKFKVSVRNGSMYAEITNAKGTASTGLARPVKKCPETPPIPPPNPTTGATIEMNGQYFKRASGDRMTVIESSEFSLFKRYLDNDWATFDPVIAQRKQLGFNMLRVWLLNHSVVAFRNGVEQDMIHPNQYDSFYPRLTQFVDFLSEQGFCVELTVFTQTQTLMPGSADQQNHLDRTVDAVRNRKSVIIELVNENDQHDNAVSRDLVRPATTTIMSHGSNGADETGVVPMWDYTLYHTNGLSEWWRKTGHNAMEKADEFSIPCISNENTRYPDNESSEIHAYDAAAGASLLCAGACYHSQGGKFSRGFDNVELNCAKSWIAGANSVPLEFQPGQYIRRDDLLHPGLLRVYERRLSDGRGYIVEIRE